MEHEISLKTTEHLSIPQITPEIRRRQILRPPVDFDLTKTTLDYALSLLGGLDPGTAAFLVVPECQRDVGTLLGKDFRLPVICVPDEFLHSVYSWALVSPKGSVYSLPSA